jgi:transcriptional regulator with XRE-family HTH domain
MNEMTLKARPGRPRKDGPPKQRDPSSADDRYKRFIGRNLAEVRRSLSMSQPEMAELFNLGDSSRLSHWERGVNYPDNLFILRLWQAYRVHPSWLLLGEKAGSPYELAVHWAAADAALLAR